MEFDSGEILFDPHFQYPKKNEDCDKYLLILNKNHTQSQNVVIVPATTNKSNIPYDSGCNDDYKLFYFDNDGSFYVKGTIIQLEFIRIMEIDWLVDMIEKTGIKRENKKIDNLEIRQIINCLKKIKDDISIEMQELIF